MSEELLTVPAVAKMLYVSEALVFKFIHTGFLVPDSISQTKSGRLPRAKFHRSTVESFLRSCTKTEYNGEALLSVSDVWNMLGITVDALNYYIKMGWIKPDIMYPSFNENRGLVRFKQSTVDDFVDAMLSSERRSALGVKIAMPKTFKILEKYRRSRDNAN